MDSDDPSFTSDQVHWLEKRVFEIGEDITECPQPRPTVTANELLESLGDCVRILADFDEHDGDEGTTYRRCLKVLTRLSQKPFQITHKPTIKPTGE
jgi:hypothetical protein